MTYLLDCRKRKRVEAVVPERTTPSRRPLVSLIILAPLLAVSFATSEGTISYFGDTEASPENSLGAGSVGFAVAADPTETTLEAGASQAFTLTLTPDVGTLPFSYIVSATTTGDATLCSSLTADAGAPLTYSGTLISLLTTATNSLDVSTLTVTLPADAVVSDGTTCVVDLSYNAYQDGGAEGTQFTDTQHALLTIHASVPAPLIIQSASFVEEPPAAASTTPEVPETAPEPELPPETPPEPPSDTPPAP